MHWIPVVFNVYSLKTDKQYVGNSQYNPKFISISLKYRMYLFIKRNNITSKLMYYLIK